MKLLTSTAVCILLFVASTAAQEPSAENFSHYREQIIERLARSSQRLGLAGDRGSRLDANVSQLFGIPTDVRVVNAVELVLPDEHHLKLTLAINSTEFFLTETKKKSDGTLLMMAFHTDLTLILRGAASGPAADSLHLLPADGDTVSAFRDALLIWDRQLARMLEPRVRK